ncbi:hypothetical protein TUMSATVNIG1_57920 (plasmid) [Vibrio nigripulchritudo]|uniref:hypothetical protein n=1 Tax=Vibrio nigripulchritudo TaxID=28173 RepID=UPI00190D0A1B|nr:hypothetical protein [Vibrio nigripulchritudo]BCL73805.1 hypothetical protein VNTUMSATTG_57420 [Vibrio nigripulchritudo]BDU35183.1 hypothetical protein TUMSATVNIG1_57920 [Vibrio nigripulchritudo]
MEHNKLFHPKSAEEFLEAFEKETGKNINNYIYDVSKIKAENIFLVGSIPQGSATTVSDIDLIVTGVRDSGEIIANDVLYQENSGGGVMIAEFFSKVNGYEIDVILLNANSIERLIDGLSTGNAHMSDFEIKILSILKRGWQLEGKLDISKLETDDIELFSAMRHFTLAQQEFNDALNATNNAPFCVSMLRSVVYRLASTFMAMNGMCFVGQKWVKKAQFMLNKGELSLSAKKFLQRLIDMYTEDSCLSMNQLQTSISSVHCLINTFNKIVNDDYLSHSIAIQINNELSALESANKEALCKILN